MAEVGRPGHLATLSRGVRLLPGMRGTVTARQLAVRARRRLRYRWLYPYTAARTHPGGVAWDVGEPGDGALSADFEVPPPGDTSDSMRQADLLLTGQIAFLNLPPVDLADPRIWTSSPDDDRLWLYNLHYGEWALTLARAFRAAGNTAYRKSLISLMSDWIESNKPGSEPGWEPYPLARRLAAWSEVALILRGDEVWREFWLASLGQSLRMQAAFLAKNLEHDVPNNHLIADYRGLASAGLTFPNWPESRAWRCLGLDGMLFELDRQILPDGTHDERTISYHAIVLLDVMSTWRLFDADGDPRASQLASTAQRMARFLKATRAPDGSWPMVNDTVPGYPCDGNDILLAVDSCFGGGEQGPSAQARPSAVFPHAGYAVLAGNSGDWAIFDAGPMGPDRVLGHGHADALSVEVHHRGKALVVDPGVFTYRQGRWRDYFRSTAAHNTAMIDGQDQCVFWGAFRVAYPPRARLVSWSGTHAVGEHRGYERLPGSVVHRRRLELVDPGTWRIDDRFEGHGQHDVSLGLQLGEGASLVVAGTSARATWSDGNWLQIDAASAPEGAQAACQDSFVSPGWNLMNPAPRYVLNWRAAFPMESRLILRAGGGRHR